MRLPVSRTVPCLLLALLLAAAGCAGPASPDMPVPSPAGPAPLPGTPEGAAGVPVVWIVYGSEKGDLSYTDAAYRGILAAQQEMPLDVREFVPADLALLPALLNSTPGNGRPGLVITVGFQYAGLVQQLAAQHPDIRFLAIDTAGIGSETIRSYEITSYGDSYLSGVLAATATKSGRVGIIMGMKTPLLDTFIDGYTAGARAAGRPVAVDCAYVHTDSVEGFTDPDQARRIAEGMYRNGTDVIFTGAGISNTGVVGAALDGTGRYVIGTDSDQTHLGPGVVLASAVKRVDRVVHTGIAQYAGGSFEGGNRVAGLEEGATGIVFNPAFAQYNETVGAWESRAADEEKAFLLARRPAGA